MKHHIKIRKDGMLEWLAPPPVPFSVKIQNKKRFSEIVPTNPFLFIAFRIIRAVFGEGSGAIPEWTRRWRCNWRCAILMGKHSGAINESRYRRVLVEWEKEKWFQPRFDL